MNYIVENEDGNGGETALSLSEISDSVTANPIYLMPGETRFDKASVHKIVQNRNEMVQILRDFLTLHPENTSLTRRARRFTE